MSPHPRRCFPASSAGGAGAYGLLSQNELLSQHVGSVQLDLAVSGAGKNAWSVAGEALSQSPSGVNVDAFSSALQFTPVSLSGFL